LQPGIGLRHQPVQTDCWREVCARKAKQLSSTDTLENTPHPEAAEAALDGEFSHESHDHHDHDGHDHVHQHGPVLNPECTRELVLDVPSEEVTKAYRTVVGNYRKYAKIPGFRAGKVPESVIKRRYATEIRKDVIDGLLPQRFNKAVAELGVKPVGQPQVTELTVEDGAPLHVKAVFEFVPAFSIEGYKGRDGAQASGRNYGRGVPGRVGAVAGVARDG